MKFTHTKHQPPFVSEKTKKKHVVSPNVFQRFSAQVEAAMGKKFKHLPLVVKQAQTKAHAMSAATLQVQLCEYRPLGGWKAGRQKQKWMPLEIAKARK